MSTLDQKRAQMAYEHVSSVKNEKDEEARKKYASMIHSLPALLRSAGLNQSLAFVHSRKNEHQRLALHHLAEQLNRIDPTIKDANKLLTSARESTLSGYLRLTREALACAAWYRRMVQGILKIEAGKDED
jgi:CRISPR-associated protein Cmr5